jgi:hypothetical protein
VAQCLVRGRVIGRRRIATQNGPRFLTLITMAAQDEFSTPATVEVRSVDQLGDIGETVSVKCRLGGFRRSYEATSEDGTKRTVQTATLTLDAE